MTVAVLNPATESPIEMSKPEQSEVSIPRLTIKFTELNDDAQKPTYGSQAAAGADLYSAEDVVVPAKGKCCVSTGIQVELPVGFYGRVAPRSGLAAKHFIDVGAGVIDSDYRGEVKVLLFNFNETDFEVKKGDRIAQLICEQIGNGTYEKVEKLDDSERGAGGFGSTGSATMSTESKSAEQRIPVRFTMLNKNAHSPTYGSQEAAGADLYSAEDVVVPANGKYCVSTGIQMELPFGYYGRVAPRSGLAAKHFIDVGAGVVDSDYRGEVKVLLFNFNSMDFEVKKGDRIAQLTCEKIGHCDYLPAVELENTTRGAGGFGSTGQSEMEPVTKKARIEGVTIQFTGEQTPTYGSSEAAGADLYSAEDVVVPAKGKLCVSTGIQMKLPLGFYGRVAPRSGLAAKHFIDVGAGVIDSDYRGEVKVLLFNFNETDFEVKKGDRIAQLICEQIAFCDYQKVDSLEVTERGAGGFGSTGK